MLRVYAFGGIVFFAFAGLIGLIMLCTVGLSGPSTNYTADTYPYRYVYISPAYNPLYRLRLTLVVTRSGGFYIFYCGPSYGPTCDCGPVCKYKLQTHIISSIKPRIRSNFGFVIGCSCTGHHHHHHSNLCGGSSSCSGGSSSNNDVGGGLIVVSIHRTLILTANHTNVGSRSTYSSILGQY